MLKRLISSALAFTLVFGAAAYLPEGVAARSGITAIAETYGDYEYRVLTDGTVEISRYSGSDTDINIPSTIDGKNVTSIGVTAFSKCEDITSVTIPNGVMTIGESAFIGCSSLVSVKLPASVKNISVWSFADCTSLTSVTVDTDNADFSSDDGILYSKDKTQLVFCPKGRSSITIPKTVTNICEFAFFDCRSLTNITIPDNVKSIGNSAFSYCTSLKSVTISNGVTSIGDNAFSICMSLTSVKLPDSITSIGMNAFKTCSSLKSVTLPNGLTSIDYQMFYACESLTDITIPDSVTSIGEQAFYNCSGLKSIIIPNSVKSIDNEAFGDCKSLTINCYSGSAAEQYAKDNNIPYQLLDASKNTSIRSAKATLSKTSYTYDGKAKKPSVTVKLSGKTLKSGTDYTVTYKNNKSVGKATVTITGKGGYTGTVTKSFKINPKKTAVKKLTSPKKAQLKVTYKKVAGVTGYQVTYSTSKKFTKSTTKTATVKGVSKLSKTVKSLKKGKTYYVKVRSYKTVGGTKYYSSYSAVKKIKVKK